MILALGLPVLLFAYLPMIDLPQHLAIASILQHLGEPRYGFAAYYTSQLNTLYILPCLLTLGLAKLMPLKKALHVVVFLSVVLYPLGVAFILRQRRRPWPLSLLALPLVYNNLFFWGFFNFNLAIGLSFFCIGLLLASRPTRATDVALALLLVAISFCHVYGLLFVAGFAVLLLLFSDGAGRRVLLRRLPAILPALVLGAVWTKDLHAARHLGGYKWLPLWVQLKLLPRHIFGGYQDSTELALLLLLLLTFALLSYASFPATVARWRRLEAPERAFYAYAALNLVLYFVLPLSTPTAKMLSVRHALLAASLLPLCLRSQEYLETRLSRTLCGVLAGAVILNSWAHLWLFAKEARPFDRVIAALPERPKLLALNLDPYGGIMANHPYCPYAAYIQAERGGLLAETFPRVFWNVPASFRSDVVVPETPFNFGLQPELYSYPGFGYYYDYVLVRGRPGRRIPAAPQFPYELMLADGPWQVYRRAAPAATTGFWNLAPSHP